MLQKIILAVAVFLIILIALTFGEGVLYQIWDWAKRIANVLIHNFADFHALIAAYIRDHTGKVVIALILTVPVSLWIWRSKGDQLGKPGMNRKIAIVLAIFLGWLGAHRFYLGQIGWGLAYLVLYYLIPPLAFIAGFVDAIRYLFMSDEQFTHISS